VFASTSACTREFTGVYSNHGRFSLSNQLVVFNNRISLLFQTFFCTLADAWLHHLDIKTHICARDIPQTSAKFASSIAMHMAPKDDFDPKSQRARNISN
jgi:hypothetical protein